MVREMTPKVIIVSGPPASGKSTLATFLGGRFLVPVFSSDMFKESIYDIFDLADSDERNRDIASKAGFEILYRIMDSMFDARKTFVAEANFHPRFNDARMRNILERASAKAFYIYCSAEREVINSRFRARATFRHPGYGDKLKINRKGFLEKMLNDNRPLNIGVDPYFFDTTNPEDIDYGNLLKDIEDFLESP